MDTRVPAPREVDEYTYRLLAADETAVRRVFDDGRSTYVQFNTPSTPPGLMLFDENGKPLTFNAYGQTAVIDSVQQGILIRTPTRTSYAQPMTPDRIARVLATKPGQPAPTPYLPTELASARAQILEAQRRLQGLANEIDKASRGEPATSVAAVKAEIDQLQTQIAGLNATMVRARFESGSTMLALKPTTKKAILEAAKLAEQIHIRGRTDATGTPKLNTQVALARAVSTRKMLVDGGVPATKLRTSYKPGDYIATNNTAEGRALNRRVELIFVVKGGERIHIALYDDDTHNNPLAWLADQIPQPAITISQLQGETKSSL